MGSAPGPKDVLAETTDDVFPLLIAVALPADDRLRLAELVDGGTPLLLVSSVDELRKLITPAPESPRGPAEVLSVHPTRPIVRWRDREAVLTPLEHALLTTLNADPLRAWTFEALQRAVWRTEHPRSRADVQSLVKRLRRKLGDLGTSVTIEAVRGIGFRLADHQRPQVG